MKKTSRLSCKGQVTIPREIRTALHLEAGDLVVYDRPRSEPSRFQLGALKSLLA